MAATGKESRFLVRHLVDGGVGLQIGVHGTFLLGKRTLFLVVLLFDGFVVATFGNDGFYLLLRDVVVVDVLVVVERGFDGVERLTVVFHRVLREVLVSVVQNIVIIFLHF